MVARDRMIDLGLNALASESDRVFLSATDPATYADVNTTHIGVKVGSRGSMFYTLSTPVQGGRLASLVGFFDGDITSNGTANFVVVADSVNQNVLLSEALGVPQAVVSGAKFSIGTLDIVFGSSSQPVAASLTVSSPIIGVPDFTKTPTTSQNLSVSSPVIGQPILIVTTSGWTNVPISNMVGTFTCEFDAVPAALASNDVAGLSNGPAAAFTDLACIVQFSAANTILVRNGGSYTSDVSVPYSAAQQFHIRFVGNITTHLYDVYVTPLSQAEVHLATAYAFRTEQSTVTQLNNFSLNATDIGTVAISNLTFNSIAANSLTVGSPVIPSVIINGKTNLLVNNMSAGSPILSSPVMIVKRSFLATTMVDSSPVFTSPSLTINSAGTAAGPFNAQSGDFAISWDASPSQSLADVATGLSNGAPAAVTDFGCIVRFSNVGNIDCRNGAAYGATTTVPYSAGLSFHFRLAVRLTNHTYDAFVTPQGQSEILLASNFAFRTEQASIAQLNYLGEVTFTGTVALSNMIGPPPPALPPVVSNQTMSLATSGTSWVAGDLVGTMVATNAPTSWTITAGNASGFYAIANNGNITVTSAGITGLNGATGTSTLTVRATNAFGIGSGTATVNYSPAVTGFDIPVNLNDPMFTNMTTLSAGHFMVNNELLSHASFTASDGACVIFNQSGSARMTYCRIDGTTTATDGGIFGQAGGTQINLDHCCINCISTLNPTATHIDGIQINRLLNQTTPGAIFNMNNSFVSAGGPDCTACMFVADGYDGTITIKDTVFEAGVGNPWGLRVHSDAGHVNLSLQNVYFNNLDGTAFLIFPPTDPGTSTITLWDNVRACTINHSTGVITLGAVLTRGSNGLPV